MAASVSTIGYGDTLEWSTDGGSTYTGEVKELKSCDLPTHTVEKIDRTHMSSPNRTKEYTPGLRDSGDLSFTFNYNSDDYEALYALEVAGTVVDWLHTLSLNDGETAEATYEYSGFVELGSASRTVEGVTEVTCTIKRTGSATFTPATKSA